MRFSKFLLGLALLLVSGLASAWIVRGQVVAILSGDTFRIRDERNAQYTVRLAGLDAPEKFQAYGQRSLDSLRELIFQRYVTVEVPRKTGSPYTGLAHFAGRDINLEQLQRGGAWYDRSQVQDVPAAQRAAYAAAEAEARL